MAKRKGLPKEIMIYQGDEIDNEPVYNLAENLDQIDDDYDGVLVGIYTLNRTSTFRLKKHLD